MILHTRAATHGSPDDNDNNHPVMSPSGDIRLVHNGVIWNHDTVRKTLGSVGKKLPDVDSSVIPAVIEKLGLASADQLSGDAAVAWFDKETGGVLHLARFSSSPLHAATLLDGTTVFASTPQILAGALQRMSLTWLGNWPSTFFEFSEGDYIQLFEGDVTAQSKVEWGDDYGYDHSRWRSVTSGAAAAWSQWDDDDYDDLPTAPRDTHRAAALTLPAMDAAESGSPENLFWAEDHEGERSEFASFYALQGYLSWYNGMTGGIYDLVPNDDDSTADVRWINHIGDLGEIDVSSGEYISWVSKPNEMEDYGSMVKSMTRDGIDLLRRVIR